MGVCGLHRASSASVSAAGHTVTAMGPIGFSATATGVATVTGAGATGTGTGTRQSNAARKSKGSHNSTKHLFKMAAALAGALVGMVAI